MFQVEHLSVAFPQDGQLHKVVDDISFSLPDGKILGVVGESGSGKSMTALAIMGLLAEKACTVSGSVYLEDQELLSMTPAQYTQVQGKNLAMVFQEPMTSLNPVMRIGRQVGESLRLHEAISSDQAGKETLRQRVLAALQEVGLSEAEKIYDQYPHELSGGMRQRVMIAQAMICHPKLLIADEPTTALDVVVQAQILQLLKRLHEEHGVSILFISHDLNVIREICDEVLVMYQGQIVERGAVQTVLRTPQHAYTKTLVARLPERSSVQPSRHAVLEIENLNVFYEEKARGPWSKKARRRVIEDLTLSVYEGEILGIVGESGCGKSTLAKAITGLNPEYEGILRMDAQLRPQMVFQDPFSSLNPAHTIGWILEEPLRKRYAKKERYARVCSMLEDIGLDASYYHRYPDELSGGQRQRISIGAALLTDSKFLIADEAVSALDVTVQSQILAFLLELHEKRKLTILFISHDLNIVRHICHRVAVLYQGKLVELGDAEEIYANPQHPYTKRLLNVGKEE